MMTVAEIVAELEALEPMRKMVKARAMVFQAELKERAAELLGLPFDTFYRYHYASWTEVRKALKLRP